MNVVKIINYIGLNKKIQLIFSKYFNGYYFVILFDQLILVYDN